MIRKQLYIAAEQQRKLHRLAARWQCTEAEVMRKALDRLPDPEASIDQRLEDAGLLIAPPDEDDLSTGEAAVALEQECLDWLATLPAPLGLTEAVVEERR